MRKNSDWVQRLRTLRHRVPGCVWLAVCSKCGHMGALPVEILIRKHGELYPVEFAMGSLTCGECRQTGSVTATMSWLCVPGCGRQRGYVGIYIPPIVVDSGRSGLEP